MENDNLRKLISFKTDGDKVGIKNMLEFLKETLQNFNFKNYVVSKNKMGNLIAIYNPNNESLGNAVVFSAHIDTVKTNVSLWSSNPWELVEREGKFFGLGVSDMKFFTAVILDLLPKLTLLNTPLIFVATTDEETTCQGIKEIIKFFKKNNIKPKFCLLGEPTDNDICLASKGFCEFKTQFFGKSCHSSFLQQGKNAIYSASQLVLFLRDLNEKYFGSGTTVNVGLIKGGKMCNIVPDKCSVNWEVRFEDRSVIDEITKDVEDKLNEIKSQTQVDFKNDVKLNIPAFNNKNLTKLDELLKIINCKSSTMFGATEAAYYQDFEVSTAIWGCSSINQAHKINESLEISKYKTYKDKFLEVVKLIINS